MRLVQVEEWQTLRVIKPRLYTAVSRIAEKMRKCDIPMDDLDKYILLRYELNKLEIPESVNQEDIDQEIIDRFKTEATELFKLVRPILQQLPPNSPSLLGTQKLLNRQAPGDTSTSKKKQTEADSDSLEEALSLSEAKSILASLISLKRLLESFSACSHGATPEATSRTLNSDVHGRKRTLIDAVVGGLRQHTACCERRARHDMLLRAAGVSWRAEETPLISLVICSCKKPIEWQEIKCSFDGGLLRNELDKKKLSLCRDIDNAQQYDQVLKLLLLEGTLYKPLKRRTHIPQGVVQMKTLKELIEKQRLWPIGPRSPPTSIFTLPEKRELSLNLGWCFLYLFECSWAHSSWSADTISLPMTKVASSDQLQLQKSPYIHCDPECASSIPDDDKLDIVMKGSIFLDLGKLLVEMELGKRVTATRCDKQGRPNLWMTIEELLHGDDMSSSSNKYLKAIEGCLELHQTIADLTPEEIAAKSADLIYESIVANLEEDFAQYRPTNRKRPREVSPPVDLDPRSIDSLPIRVPTSSNEEKGVAGTGTLCNASKGSADNRPSRIQPEESVLVTDQESNRKPKRPRIGTGGSFTKRTMVTRSMKCAAPSENIVNLSDDSKLDTASGENIVNLSDDSKLDTASGENIVNLSDDSKLDTASSENPVNLFDGSEFDTRTEGFQEVKHTEDFLREMDCFVENFVENFVGKVRPGDKPPVKVCIIDTGIDMEHAGILAAKDQGRLESTRNFVGKDSSDINDEAGHGTNVAELFLRFAPQAKLYVARVAAKMTIPKKDTILIAEAVKWAVEQDVDIISLSLGLEKLDAHLETAIREAYSKDKIIIAAAGNSGGNKKRAYPASNERVLCIHASDGLGRSAAISPFPLNNTSNFMTLGIAVPLLWKGGEVRKSGTSLATPVAAAIAANLIELVSRLDELDDRQLKRIRSKQGMTTMFSLICRESGGYQYLAPWLLWNKQTKEEYIKEKIKDTLKDI